VPFGIHVGMAAVLVLGGFIVIQRTFAGAGRVASFGDGEFGAERWHRRVFGFDRN
jgi:hypothetical protein